MTVHTERQAAAPSWPMYGVLGAGVALVLTAIGTFLDLDGGGAEQGWQEYAVVVGVVLVATAVVFGLVVKGAEEGNSARRGLILAVLGLLTGVVFWSGLPTVLAFGAIACALMGREVTGIDKAALGIAGVTLIAVTVLAFTG
jgi:hypothetical protein